MAMYPKPPMPKTKATGVTPKPKPRSMSGRSPGPVKPGPERRSAAELAAVAAKEMAKGQKVRQQPRKKKMGY